MLKHDFSESISLFELGCSGRFFLLFGLLGTKVCRMCQRENVSEKQFVDVINKFETFNIHIYVDRARAHISFRMPHLIWWCNISLSFTLEVCFSLARSDFITILRPSTVKLLTYPVQIIVSKIGVCCTVYIDGTTNLSAGAVNYAYE